MFHGRESLASLLLYVLLPESHAALAGLLTNHSRAISVIITSRIVLNLRHVARGGLDLTTLTAPITEIETPPLNDVHRREPHGLHFRHTQTTHGFELELDEWSDGGVLSHLSRAEAV